MRVLGRLDAEAPAAEEIGQRSATPDLVSGRTLAPAPCAQRCDVDSNSTDDKVRSQRGAILTARNAGRLRRSALTLSQVRSFGPAVALLILAAEEAIKSAVLLARSYGLDLAPDGIDPYMRWHSSRMEMARSLLIAAHYSQQVVKADVAKASVETLLSEMMQKFVDDLVSSRIPAEVTSLKSWWREANELKQRGFYVDRAGNGWTTPDSVGLECFDQTLHMVDPVIAGARIFSWVNRKMPQLIVELLGNLDLEAVAEQVFTQVKGLEHLELEDDGTG